MTPGTDSLRRDWIRFALLNFCFMFGFSAYNGLFQNYVRESLGVGPRQLGILESLREIPGLLTAFTAGTLAALVEPRLAGYALALCGIGIGLTGRMGSYWPLVGITMLWSVGFHLFISVQPAITMSLSKGLEGGKRLGQIAGVGSAATLFALAFSRIAKESTGYETLFYVAGIAIVIAGLLAFGLSVHAHGGSRQRIVFRREYRLYYLLTFLEGCRRQIFGTFASFTLIAVYNTSVGTMLTLAFVNALVMAVAGPIIGRQIDRMGERKMLSAYYVLLVIVFTGYATMRSAGVLYGLYLLDSLLFGFGVGMTTYLHRIVRPGELTPSLAMGMTMNHVAAVLIPAIGGALWQSTGYYQIPFAIGIVVVLTSLAAVQKLGPSLVHTQFDSSSNQA